MENTQLLKEFRMTDKKVLRIRILIAVATFLVLSWILVDMILKTTMRSSHRWYSNPIEIILFVISFITLANGVSYLSETFRKDRKYLRILTGILSLMIFVFTFFPQDQDSSPIIMLTIFVGLSISSILISVFSVLEWTTCKKRFKWLFIFLFALNSGVYSCLIFAMILRGYNFSEGGILIIGYGAILFLISIAVNLIVVSSLKN